MADLPIYDADQLSKLSKTYQTILKTMASQLAVTKETAKYDDAIIKMSHVNYKNQKNALAFQKEAHKVFAHHRQQIVDFDAYKNKQDRETRKRQIKEARGSRGVRSAQQAFRSMRGGESAGKQLMTGAFGDGGIARATGKFSHSMKSVYQGTSEISGSFAKLRNLSSGFFKSGKQGASVLAKSFSMLGLSIGLATAGLSLAMGAVVLVLSKIKDIVLGVDNAAAALTNTVGALDNSFSLLLLNATANTSILGGNVALAGEYAGRLINNLSPAIQITSDIVSTAAEMGEVFGLGSEKAAKLVTIFTQLSNSSIADATTESAKLVASFGRLGPAITKNLVDSFDAVSTQFDLTLHQLAQQSVRATNLGISLTTASNSAAKLLDFTSSISSEFRTSALLGRQINLNKARQLAWDGQLNASNEEMLNQFESILDSGQMNFVQAKAIQEVTGKTVAELRRELRVRKELGNLGRIDARTRETALSRLDVITRKLEAGLFRILSSPTVQKSFEEAADQLINFLQSGGFEQIIDSLKSVATLIHGLISGSLKLSFNFIDFMTGDGLSIKGGSSSQKVTSINDGIITPKGDIVKTNPRDYIIATTNPSAMVQSSGGTNANNALMEEVKSLLVSIKQNGVHANVYLDSKKLSSGIANSLR